MQLKKPSYHRIKAVLSHLPQFQKGFIALACLIGLLLALIPRAVPASSGGELEWEIVLPAGRIEDSSPTLADIDGDDKDEIIIGTVDKPDGANPALVVLEDDGTIKWSRNLAQAMKSTPTVVDISSPPDGISEIIITTGGRNSPAFTIPGYVIAFDRDGNQLWEYETNDAEGDGHRPHGNFASPVAGDVDADGDVEIVVSSWDRNIYLLDHQGNRVWYYHVADTIWSTPVLVDLDNNETLEIVVGTDIAGGGILPDGYQPVDGGFVLILDKDGNKLARRQMNEAIYSSPVVGDADGDGVVEIFVGTGHFYYKEGKYDQPFVSGFSIDMSGEPDEYGARWELEYLPGWPKPVAYAGMSSPALADLDNDGDLEVIIGSAHDGGSRGCSDSESDQNCHGAIYAWHHTGDLVSGFPMWPKENNGKNWFIRSSPTVADIDGDNELEIAVSMGWEVIIVGPNGVQEAALHTDRSVFAAPAIGDIDRDGQTNVIIGGGDAFNDTDYGHVYNFEFSGNTFNANALPWPQFHGDAQNSGVYRAAPTSPTATPTPSLTATPTAPPIALPQIPTEISILHEIGDNPSAVQTLRLRNLGGAPFNFDVTNLPVRVALSSTSGQVPPHGELSLTMTVNTAGLGERNYKLGLLDVYDSDTNTLSGDISVSIIVGELNYIYLPITNR